MANNDLLYAELIALLKMVKQPEQVDNPLVDELLNAGIAAAVAMVQREQGGPFAQALEVARMVTLKHFDLLLLDAARHGDG